MKNYIGIDNGVSGSIGIISPEGHTSFYPTPTVSQQDYTKKKANITRVAVGDMKEILLPYCTENTLVLIERPMVNPTRFKATISAVRCLEATLTILEDLLLPYQFIDSKEWQKEFLPQGVKGSTDLKKASQDRGRQLFPHFTDMIKKQGDADSLLIAAYGRRKQL